MRNFYDCPNLVKWGYEMLKHLRLFGITRSTENTGKTIVTKKECLNLACLPKGTFNEEGDTVFVYVNKLLKIRDDQPEKTWANGDFNTYISTRYLLEIYAAPKKRNTFNPAAAFRHIFPKPNAHNQVRMLHFKRTRSDFFELKAGLFSIDLKEASNHLAKLVAQFNNNRNKDPQDQLTLQDKKVIGVYNTWAAFTDFVASLPKNRILEGQRTNEPSQDTEQMPALYPQPQGNDVDSLSQTTQTVTPPAIEDAESQEAIGYLKQLSEMLEDPGITNALQKSNTCMGLILCELEADITKTKEEIEKRGWQQVRESTKFASLKKRIHLFLVAHDAIITGDTFRPAIVLNLQKKDAISDLIKRVNANTPQLDQSDQSLTIQKIMEAFHQSQIAEMMCVDIHDLYKERKAQINELLLEMRLACVENGSPLEHREKQIASILSKIADQNHVVGRFGKNISKVRLQDGKTVARLEKARAFFIRIPVVKIFICSFLLKLIKRKKTVSDRDTPLHDMYFVLETDISTKIKAKFGMKHVIGVSCYNSHQKKSDVLRNVRLQLSAKSRDGGRLDHCKLFALKYAHKLNTASVTAAFFILLLASSIVTRMIKVNHSIYGLPLQLVRSFADLLVVFFVLDVIIDYMAFELVRKTTIIIKALDQIVFCGILTLTIRCGQKLFRGTKKIACLILKFCKSILNFGLLRTISIYANKIRVFRKKPWKMIDWDFFETAFIRFIRVLLNPEAYKNSPAQEWVDFIKKTCLWETHLKKKKDFLEALKDQDDQGFTAKLERFQSSIVGISIPQSDRSNALLQPHCSLEALLAITTEMAGYIDTCHRFEKAKLLTCLRVMLENIKNLYSKDTPLVRLSKSPSGRFITTSMNMLKLAIRLVTRFEQEDAMFHKKTEAALRIIAPVIGMGVQAICVNNEFTGQPVSRILTECINTFPPGMLLYDDGMLKQHVRHVKKNKGMLTPSDLWEGFVIDFLKSNSSVFSLLLSFGTFHLLQQLQFKATVNLITVASQTPMEKIMGIINQGFGLNIEHFLYDTKLSAKLIETLYSRAMLLRDMGIEIRESIEPFANDVHEHDPDLQDMNSIDRRDEHSEPEDKTLGDLVVSCANVVMSSPFSCAPQHVLSDLERPIRAFPSQNSLASAGT